MREFPSQQAILKVFEQNPDKTFRLRDLVLQLGLRSSQARELKHALKDLARGRKIAYLKKSHFALASKDHTGASPRLRNGPGVLAAPSRSPRSPNVVSGRLIGHRDGYGFVVPEAPIEGTDLDIYIRPDGMGSALHGDRVEVQVLRSKADGRLEGRILRVTERAQKTVVGQFHSGPRHNYVQPYDARIPVEIVIPHGQEWPSEGPQAEGEEDRKAPRPPHVGAGPLSRHRQFGGESEGKAPALQP